jgi:hypothetical protein
MRDVKKILDSKNSISGYQEIHFCISKLIAFLVTIGIYCAILYMKTSIFYINSPILRILDNKKFQFLI